MSLCTSESNESKELADGDIEVKAFSCPRLLRRNFIELFPDRNLKACDHLTVITYAMKSEHDMGLWSEEMEAERTDLTEKFIQSASRICQTLQKDGYWADFIDPASGRPYFGSYTNATFFETNGHFENLGLKVKDLGCCQVIEHNKWGRMVFVGTIITDAELDSAPICKLIN